MRVRARWRSVAHGALRRDPGGVVYGIIVIAALLAAESGEHDSYLATVASAALATALYWLAHSYAQALGSRLRSQERLTAARLGRALAHDLSIVRGAAVPLAALLAAWAAGASQQTGVTVALWGAIASLIAFELAASARAGAGARELLLDAGVGASMGVAIVLLKVLVHH